jgi:preprotein translocase subunit SecF
VVLFLRASLFSNQFKNKYMIREMFEDVPIISSIITLILLGIVFISIDGLMSKPEFYSGSVIDKHYSAESHRTGTGVGITSSGQTGVVMTSESEPEKFLLMVKTETGNVVTAKCKAELYYEKQIGQEIEFAIYKGLFTNMSWSVRGVR